MEKCGNLGGLRGPACNAIAACSACAGDYEDPDRTAWSAADGDELDDAEEEQTARRKIQKKTSDGNSDPEQAIGEVAGRRNSNESKSHDQK